MTHATTQHDGVVCWAELATPDLDRAAAFYAAVLGWTTTDDGDGLLARRDGRDVARLRTSVDAGSAAVWTPYFAVDDADDACERLTELGGSVLHEPEEVGDARLVLALDPGGAEFGGREAPRDPEPGEHPASGREPGPGRAPGALVGADAASGEPGQSRSFYARLFGFTYADAEAGATIVHPVAGAMGTLDIAGDALPHWRLRFGVADLDAARDAVAGAGGVVTSPVGVAQPGEIRVRDDGGAEIVLVAAPP